MALTVETVEYRLEWKSNFTLGDKWAECDSHHPSTFGTEAEARAQIGLLDDILKHRVVRVATATSRRVLPDAQRPWAVGDTYQHAASSPGGAVYHVAEILHDGTAVVWWRRTPMGDVLTGTVTLGAQRSGEYTR